MRFRACHGLKLGITSFPVLRLRAKSESVNLPDALPVSELAEFDLQAIFEYTGSLLGASGNQIGVWQADNLEVKMHIEAGDEASTSLCGVQSYMCLRWKINNLSVESRNRRAHLAEVAKLRQRHKH